MRVAAAALAMLLLLTQRAWAVEVSATAAVLMDCGTGRILYEKNADRRMLIASTTKILTALVVLEDCGMQQEVNVTGRHMAEGSSMYLKIGEKVTVESLLYGLMLSSRNDAALALAESCGGEAHYSTARDMAKLAAFAAENPTFMRICSTISAQTGGRSLKNHNRLLRELEGCVGMKTGYTKAAGRTLVSCVERDGRTLVAVTLQDGNDWADHAALYAYGFEGNGGVETAFFPNNKRKL